MSEPRRDGLSTYLTPAEAAALLRLSAQGVRQWVREGKLEAHRLGTRRWRVLRSSVERLLPTPAAERILAQPPPPAVERVLALLPELDDDEKRRVAIVALGGHE